jgi:hypothetical protein
MFEKMSGSQLASSSAKTVAPAAVAPARASETEPDANPFELNEFGFETAERMRPILSSASEAPPDLQGIQKYSERVFSDGDADGGMFADLAATAAPQKKRGGDPERAERAAARPVPEAPARRRAEKTQDLELDDQFVDLPQTGGRADIPPIPPEVVEDAIDLYALGAVDYDPAVHG